MGKEVKKFQGKLLNLYVRRETYPNGYVGTLELIKHPGAVLIIPILENGSIVMIRQFRPVIGKYIWEFPAGTLEPNEKPHVCARRELIEETGYKAGKIKRLGEIFPGPGYTTEKIVIYKAWNLSKVEQKSMEDEVITKKIVTKKQIKEMLAKGKIVDAKTLSALMMLDSR